MDNEYLRVAALPNECQHCSHSIEGKVENINIIRTANGTSYRFRCENCFETLEQACPECGHREFDASGNNLMCIACGKILR